MTSDESSISDLKKNMKTAFPFQDSPIISSKKKIRSGRTIIFI